MRATASLPSYPLVSDWSIQAWIDDCIAHDADDRAHSFFVGDGSDLDVTMSSAAAATPTRRRREEEPFNDVEATSRPHGQLDMSDLVLDETVRPRLAYTESSSPGTSSRCSSGRSSPSKKERSLRHTTDYLSGGSSCRSRATTPLVSRPLWYN